MQLEKHIQNEIIALAKECALKKVLLFGSRARGDNHPLSDIDLAVSGGDVVKFCTEIDDFVSTLLMFDVVNVDDPVQPELLASIYREGVLLYEKV